VRTEQTRELIVALSHSNHVISDTETSQLHLLWAEAEVAAVQAEAEETRFHALVDDSELARERVEVDAMPETPRKVHGGELLKEKASEFRELRAKAQGAQSAAVETAVKRRQLAQKQCDAFASQEGDSLTQSLSSIEIEAAVLAGEEASHEAVLADLEARRAAVDSKCSTALAEMEAEKVDALPPGPEKALAELLLQDDREEAEAKKRWKTAAKKLAKITQDRARLVDRVAHDTVKAGGKVVHGELRKSCELDSKFVDVVSSFAVRKGAVLGNSSSDTKGKKSVADWHEVKAKLPRGEDTLMAATEARQMALALHAKHTMTLVQKQRADLVTDEAAIEAMPSGEDKDKARQSHEENVAIVEAKSSWAAQKAKVSDALQNKIKQDRNAMTVQAAAASEFECGEAGGKDHLSLGKDEGEAGVQAAEANLALAEAEATASEAEGKVSEVTLAKLKAAAEAMPPGPEKKTTTALVGEKGKHVAQFVPAWNKLKVNLIASAKNRLDVAKQQLKVAEMESGEVKDAAIVEVEVRDAKSMAMEASFQAQAASLDKERGEAEVEETTGKLVQQREALSLLPEGPEKDKLSEKLEAYKETTMAAQQWKMAKVRFAALAAERDAAMSERASVIAQEAATALEGKGAFEYEKAGSSAESSLRLGLRGSKIRSPLVTLVNSRVADLDEKLGSALVDVSNKLELMLDVEELRKKGTTLAKKFLPAGKGKWARVRGNVKDAASLKLAASKWADVDVSKRQLDASASQGALQLASAFLLREKSEITTRMDGSVDAAAKLSLSKALGLIDKALQQLAGMEPDWSKVKAKQVVAAQARAEIAKKQANAASECDSNGDVDKDRTLAALEIENAAATGIGASLEAEAAELEVTIVECEYSYAMCRLALDQGAVSTMPPGTDEKDTATRAVERREEDSALLQKKKMSKNRYSALSTERAALARERATMMASQGGDATSKEVAALDAKLAHLEEKQGKAQAEIGESRGALTLATGHLAVGFALLASTQAQAMATLAEAKQESDTALSAAKQKWGDAKCRVASVQKDKVEAEQALVSSVSEKDQAAARHQALELQVAVQDLNAEADTAEAEVASATLQVEMKMVEQGGAGDGAVVAAKGALAWKEKSLSTISQSRTTLRQSLLEAAKARRDVAKQQIDVVAMSAGTLQEKAARALNVRGAKAAAMEAELQHEEEELTLKMIEADADAASALAKLSPEAGQSSQGKSAEAILQWKEAQSAVVAAAKERIGVMKEKEEAASVGSTGAAVGEALQAKAAVIEHRYADAIQAAAAKRDTGSASD